MTVNKYEKTVKLGANGTKRLTTFALSGKLCGIIIGLPIKGLNPEKDYVVIKSWFESYEDIIVFKKITLNKSTYLVPGEPFKDSLGHDVNWSSKSYYLADDSLVFDFEGIPDSILNLKVIYEA